MRLGIMVPQDLAATQLGRVQVDDDVADSGNQHRRAAVGDDPNLARSVLRGFDFETGVELDFVIHVLISELGPAGMKTARPQPRKESIRLVRSVLIPAP